MSLQREEVLAVGPQTVSGDSSSRSFPTATMLEAHVRITTGGTVTRFDLWFQFSDDDVVWFDGVMDLGVQTSATDAGGTTREKARNVVNNKAGTTAENWYAVYKHLPARYVRAKWILNGTTITFGVVLTGK